MRMSLPLPVLALTLLASSAVAQSGPNPYLAQAKVFYQGLEFEKCLSRLGQAAKWKNSPQEAVDVEIYSGLCNYNLGNAKDAEAHFQLAVQLNPNATLPPYTSPKIEALFKKVKDALPRSATQPAAVAAADPKASSTASPPRDTPKKTELVPETKQENAVDAELRESSRGGGRNLGVPAALGGLAAVSAGVGAFMGVQAKQLEAQANDVNGAGRFESDAIRLGDEARQRAMFANVGFGVAAAAATGAIVTFLLSGDGEEPAQTSTASGSGGGF